MSGYIFIAIYQFFLAKKIISEKTHIFWCVIISSLIKSLIETLDLLILSKYQFSFTGRFIFGVLLAMILSVICVKLSKCKYTHKVFDLINHKSINNDIWTDIIDYDIGTTLHLVCNDCNISYWGVLVIHEEKGLESWFVLKDYIIEYGDNSTFMNSKDLDNPSTIAINLKNIKHIELLYNNDTAILKQP